MLVSGYTVYGSEIVPGVNINFNYQVGETVDMEVLHPWITPLVSSLTFETMVTWGIPNPRRYLFHVTNPSLSTVYPIASSIYKCSPYQHFSGIRRMVDEFNDAFAAADYNYWVATYPGSPVPYPGCPSCAGGPLKHPTWWLGSSTWAGNMVGGIHYKVIPDIDALMIDWDYYHRFMFSVWDIPLTFEEEVALYGEPKTPVSYKVLNSSYAPASASTILSALSCEHEAVLLKTFDGDTWVITDKIPNFIIIA
jgi:hypothetical protein